MVALQFLKRNHNVFSVRAKYFTPQTNTQTSPLALPAHKLPFTIRAVRVDVFTARVLELFTPRYYNVNHKKGAEHL